MFTDWWSMKPALKWPQNKSLMWVLWLFRRASPKAKEERGIFVKHFKNIPMADMEIVLVSSFLSLSPNGPESYSFLHFLYNYSLSLGPMFGYHLTLFNLYLWQPEKKNPGLTPMDWVKFLGSAVVGLVSFLVAMKFVYVHCSDIFYFAKSSLSFLSSTGSCY